MKNSEIPKSFARRHDLDALRAIAMLLGIVLHGILSFLPFAGAWPIQDTKPNEFFVLVFIQIHGFRMPLFFLISGFFTAMLWRKRGRKALAIHRFKRIFLPLVLSLVTIIPLTWYVGGVVTSENAAAQNAGDQDDQGEREFGSLLEAAVWGDAESVKEFLETGADVHAVDQDGSTALHSAVFFGRADIAELLLDAGANPNAKNNRGERPVDLFAVPWKITSMIAKMLKVEFSEEEVTKGRKLIAERMGFSIDSETRVFGSLRGLLVAPILGHLWFLWFLCWFVVGFLLVVTIGRSLGIGGLPRWMIVSSWRYVWLIPLTVIPQWYMRESFGPDTSDSLLPRLTVLNYYALFFGFGVMYFDANDRDGEVGERWKWVLPLALLIVLPIGISTMEGQDTTSRAVTVVCQAAYAWLFSFGMMGLFRALLSRENKWMRYISDSSYWLYLAHIPLILYAQYMVKDWDAPSVVKFLVVSVATTGILLVMYQLFIRYTPIGTLLNGSRRRPQIVVTEPTEIAE